MQYLKFNHRFLSVSLIAIIWILLLYIYSYSAPIKAKQQFLYGTMLTYETKTELLGYHLDTFITSNWYYSLVVSGSLDSRSKFGQAALGAGYEWQPSHKLKIDWKGLAGSAGSQVLELGDGLSLETQVGIQYQIWERFYMTGSLGYLTFPSGDFSTPFMQLGFMVTSKQFELPLKLFLERFFQLQPNYQQTGW